jgi:hypothetical protein
MWLNYLSPHRALKPRTNEPNMEIHHLTGSSNEADALSRRSELQHAITTAEQQLLDKDLEDMHDFLSSMSHMQVNDTLLHQNPVCSFVRPQHSATTLSLTAYTLTILTIST